MSGVWTLVSPFRGLRRHGPEVPCHEVARFAWMHSRQPADWTPMGQARAKGEYRLLTVNRYSIAWRSISPADQGGARISSCERSYNAANRAGGGGLPLRHRFASYWLHSHARHKLALRPGPSVGPSRTLPDRWWRPPSSGYRRPGPLPSALLLPSAVPAAAVARRRGARGGAATPAQRSGGS